MSKLVNSKNPNFVIYAKNKKKTPSQRMICDRCKYLKLSIICQIWKIEIGLHFFNDDTRPSGHISRPFELDWIAFWKIERIYIWLSARLQLLQCISNEATAVLHLAIDTCISINGQTDRQTDSQTHRQTQTGWNQSSCPWTSLRLRRVKMQQMIHIYGECVQVF